MQNKSLLREKKCSKNNIETASTARDILMKYDLGLLQLGTIQ